MPLSSARRAIAVLALSGVCTAQADAVPEGHSVHGSVFNEGPRQRAYLMDGMNPGVHFPATTAAPRAQQFIDQGLVQLHGFWHFEAERSFRQAAALDPDCAIAYWGMAMANVDNPQRARGFAWEAHRRRTSASDREQRHIEALARFYDAEAEPAADAEWQPPLDDADKKRRQRYVEDLEAIIHEHPHDIETKALLVNQLWLDQRAGRRILSRQANQALLEQVFAAQPDHPAHHYRIHLWDKTKTAHRVTDSAAAIGHAAPGIAHMWHMAGHIWAKLDRHGDAALVQEASARVDHAHMMRDWVLPDQIHNYAHNNEWLSRSLRHVGRVHDAIDLAKNMIELPRHPKWNLRDGSYNSATYGRRRLIEALVLFERWRDLADLLDTMYLEPGSSIEHRAEHAALTGLAGHHLGDRDACAAQIPVLEGLLVEARAARAEAVDTAEEQAFEAGDDRDAVDEAMAKAGTAPTRLVRRVRDQRRMLEGLVAAAAGDWDTALAALEKSSLHRVTLSRLQLASGRPDDARKTAERASAPGKAAPLANLCHVLWEVGDHDAAVQRFEELRSFSAHFDLDHAVFERLAPIVEKLGLPADWRVDGVLADDMGQRPDLATLGPVRWAPPRAPAWSLPRPGGAHTALADYRGRPVLVVFFLGYGCVHCVEQLVALKPTYARFRDAGIDIVAIGTDSLADLARAAADAGDDERYPFPIVADPELAVFKQWRCHDDFEAAPLHGTFLLDGAGRLRWLDISYEPFMDVEFLLEEGPRLLGLPAAAAPLARPTAARPTAAGATARRVIL